MFRLSRARLRDIFVGYGEVCGGSGGGAVWDMVLLGWLGGRKAERKGIRIDAGAVDIWLIGHLLG